MSDDLLDDAVAAYTRARRAPADTAGTRARLLRAARVDQRRRRMRGAVGIVVALLATNATTWAWSSGRIERAVAGWRGGQAVAEVEAPAGAVPGAAPEPGAILRTDIVDRVRFERGSGASPPPEGPTAITASSIRPRPTRPGGAPASTSTGDAPAPTNAGAPTDADLGDADLAPVDPGAAPELPDSADRLAFEAAHRAHFQGGADAAALEAWDAYLAAHPRGRFVPEATFNRVICLLRLGETAQARPALEALAAGTYGAAYQEDARVLLEGR